MTEPQLSALEETPDECQAQALAAALATWARTDTIFAAHLDAWHRHAQQLMTATGAGDVATTISGGSQGNVVTTRDVSGGLHFGAPVSPRQPDEGLGSSRI
ncbi:hypothetical protein ABZ636_37075 [Streptomyces sp. NPDC007251]|uniref:hypothetical protein n=1 Tax=Streptomyces sp. NPDC007251 TaxID=3154483 RepID=UPI00340C3D5B